MLNVDPHIKCGVLKPEGEINMGIRCKMKLEAVIGQLHGGAKAIFRCEYDRALIEEDRAFEKYTPTGFAEFQVNNPKAAEQLTIGQHYYVDFTPVPAPASD